MLGPLEVRTGAGPPVPVGGALLRTLLILLALEPGQVVPTSRLVDGLWEERVPSGAGNALQALVSRLRRAVPELVVTARPAGYQLDLDPGDTDIGRFERLAAAGHARLRDDPAAAAAILTEALALWRGPALADVADAGFARAPIARLDELRLTALQDRIDADLLLGPPASLIAELEGLVAAHPLREPLVARLMRALSGAGRPGAALAAYEQARARLADQLGADPSAELAALHLEILRADGAAEPAQASRGSNLRAELTSFVGRDRELVEVGRLLRDHRLTTLTGPGGAGKTRLAVEAAGAQVGTAPDGVWLVELAPVSDPGEVAPAVLAALGLREQALVRGARAVPAPEAAMPPVDRLVAALATKQALLVLDNCEHLVATAADLAYRLLGACPRIRVLATSREPLNITGETLYPVGSLALPPEGGSPQTLRGYASVQLLVQRARAVRPGFAVDAGNADAVARVCRALDGMPLAIELAAARLRTLSPEQLAARLDDRFRLLTGGSRTALPRHQTLRAVVDWSWDLLDDAERALWRRFSAFAGGATLEAVEAVCAGGPVAADAVLDLLAALVDKSLLAVRHGPDGPRYRMLEIIKAYGQERLGEAGEADAVRVAHGAYFQRFAEEAAQPLLRGEQLPWLARLADDQDNLNMAVRNAIEAGDADTALALVGALGWYWFLRGYKKEGTDLIGAALAVPGEASDERRAVGYAVGALLAIDGATEGSIPLDWFTRSAEYVARLSTVEVPLLRLVGPLRVVFDLAERGEWDAPPINTVLDKAVEDPDPWLGATARLLRGHMTLNFGVRHGDADADFRAAYEIYRDLGERWGMATTLASLATQANWRGDYAMAASHHERALALMTELDAQEDIVQFRAQLARERWLLGDRERGRAEAARARREAEGLGMPELQAWVTFATSDLARLDGDLAAARADLIAAQRLRTAFRGAPQYTALVASGLGYVAGAEGDLAAARRYHAEAFAAAKLSVDGPVVASVLVGLADLALREGEAARAATLLGASVAIRGMPDKSLLDAARIEAEARAALGDAGFDEAFGGGRATNLSTVDSVVTSAS